MPSRDKAYFLLGSTFQNTMRKVSSLAESGQPGSVAFILTRAERKLLANISSRLLHTKKERRKIILYLTRWAMVNYTTIEAGLRSDINYCLSEGLEPMALWDRQIEGIVKGEGL